MNNHSHSEEKTEKTRYQALTITSGCARPKKKVCGGTRMKHEAQGVLLATTSDDDRAPRGVFHRLLGSTAVATVVPLGDGHGSLGSDSQSRSCYVKPS